VSKLAAADKRAISRAFGRMTKPGRDRDVSNRSFHHQMYKPRKRGPTSTESLDAITPPVNQARSSQTVQDAKRDAKQVRSKRENRTS